MNFAAVQTLGILEPRKWVSSTVECGGVRGAMLEMRTASVGSLNEGRISIDK